MPRTLTQSKFIYAHRGLWDQNTPKNSKTSLEAAVTAGFSIETDIRLYNNNLVISHDADLSGEEVCLNAVIIEDKSIALNIKSDGLLTYVESWLRNKAKENIFVFDGSIPEMYKYSQSLIPHALRLSEFETELPWIPNIIWLDSFTHDWWLNDLKVIDILKQNKVVIVSPELHGRDPRRVWDFILGSISDYPDLSFCTDYPYELWDLVK